MWCEKLGGSWIYALIIPQATQAMPSYCRKGFKGDATRQESCKAKAYLLLVDAHVFQKCANLQEKRGNFLCPTTTRVAKQHRP